MNWTNTLKGSTLNVSPLCQGCALMHFAEQNDIMFHQCEICQNEYQNMKHKEQIEWDYMSHTDIRS